MKIQSFTDLDAWKEGHKLVLKIYLITKKFPREEKYSLVDQMRRSAVSVTSNLAEGFQRKSSKEKIQFYYISLSSLTELHNQLLISRDVGYLDNEVFDQLATLSLSVRKLMHGLLRYLHNDS